jgi:hypothetical protein
VRIGTRYLLALAVFGAVLATVYWFVTYEVVGAVLLASFAAMPTIVAAYVWRRRLLDVERPEDDAAGEAASAAGETLGPFPSATIWPPLLVLGVVVTGAALIYGLILLPAGLGLLVWAVVGLMRESRG